MIEQWLFFEPSRTRLKKPFAVNDYSVHISQHFQPSSYFAYSVVLVYRRFLTPDEHVLSFECPALPLKPITVLQSLKNIREFIH
jgi:hypothetical protein